METKLAMLDEVLNGLMQRYKERVPDVSRVIHEMIKNNIISNGEEIQNDHIAFRSVGVPFLGIQSLEKIFLHYGYEKRESYSFPEKKLDAYWYSPPKDSYPRIFISELRVDDLSSNAQAIIKNYTDGVKDDPVHLIDLDNAKEVDHFLHSSLWKLPAYQDYANLLLESEYAAWVIYNRYYLNHFTISVHNLKEGYNTIPAFNNFLEKNGFTLNDSGGKFKTSEDGLLLQSSTVAKTIEAIFADGVTKNIPGSYVEFAERRVLPQFLNLPFTDIKRLHRREGFEASNADKIFESTYSSQTNKT